VAWIAGEILHHAQRACLSEDDARALIADRARLEQLARGAELQRVARQ
jgi:hypothetical protein